MIWEERHGESINSGATTKGAVCSLSDETCACFRINVHRVGREPLLHIHEVNYKLSLMIKGTFSKVWTQRSADLKSQGVGSLNGL